MKNFNPVLTIEEANQMSEDLQSYMKSLNPSEGEQLILIYGSKYRLWRDGKYIGIATWTKDDNVGDSFQVVDPLGRKPNQVYIADKWDLIKGGMTAQ